MEKKLETQERIHAAGNIQIINEMQCLNTYFNKQIRKLEGTYWYFKR